MAKGIPTTKTCDEVCRMITGYGCGHHHMYVQTTFDPTSTHALYGVTADRVDYYKDQIKSIGGKYIRVVRASGRDYKIICFRLGLTEPITFRFYHVYNWRQRHSFLPPRGASSNAASFPIHNKIQAETANTQCICFFCLYRYCLVLVKFRE